MDDALNARFGWSAFTPRAGAIAERDIVDRMPEYFDRERREKLVRLFAAVRRFAQEQRLVESRDRSRIVAGASVEVGTRTPSVLPMLPAVTEFARSLDEEASERAVDAPHYRDSRAIFSETAARIWREPTAAVGKIEDLVMRGFAGERIAAAVANDPAAFGALRGSDRLIDRMLAPGRERKEALRAASEASVRLRALGAAYVSAFEAERRVIGDERRCMKIAIPGLSQAAEDALRGLAAQMKRKGSKLDVAAGSLDPTVRREFIAVSKALDARFGRNAILRGEKNIINRVPPTQRRAFEAMHERLKVLQQTVRMQESRQIISERQQRTIDRTGSITH